MPLLLLLRRRNTFRALRRVHLCARSRCTTAEESAPRKYKVYTKTGDKGTSSLYNGTRKPKDDVYFEALGATDELNSQIGLAREFCEQSGNGLVDDLIQIQSDLMDVGSAVATPLTGSSEWKIGRTKFEPERVASLEVWIDKMDEELPPLKNFILPSGGFASSCLHVCRTQARRAERIVVPLVRNGDVDDRVGIYLNRLSDYFFVAARYAAKKDGKTEIVYKKFAGATMR